MIEPLGYFEFLKLLKNAKIVYTDSGGVQEEACILKVPCITLRYNTKRLETLYIGANTVAGFPPNNNRRNTENAGKVKELEQPSRRRKSRGKNHKYITQEEAG
jgi:UDP-N-acetylglucosamine 2-epimerase